MDNGRTAISGGKGPYKVNTPGELIGVVNTFGAVPKKVLVRNFLNIDIVAHEELFDKSKLAHVEKQGGENSPHATLENCMASHGLTFEKLKTKCINAESYKFKNPEQWNSLKDIPKKDVFYIMGILNKK